MPVNSGLADVSNALLFSTVILYALAMLAYACDFAFARQRVLADVEVPELVAVGAGGPAAAVRPRARRPVPPPAPPAGEQASRWPSGFWIRVAFALTCIGVTCHV